MAACHHAGNVTPTEQYIAPAVHVQWLPLTQLCLRSDTQMSELGRAKDTRVHTRCLLGILRVELNNKQATEPVSCTNVRMPGFYANTALCGVWG